MLTRDGAPIPTHSRTEFNASLPSKYKKPKMKSGTRPSDWGWLQRLFPYGQADKTAHIDAIRQAQKMRAAVASAVSSAGNSKAGLSQIPWDFAGPENIGGRISDIEFNPLDPAIVYAGAATGGVFKSTDGGWTWTPVFDEAAALSVGDIAVDPVNPDIVYVGTGEANGGHNNFPGAGVYKSTDAGATWQLLGLERTASIGRIVIDPSNPQRVYVAAVGSYFGPDSDRGLYRSMDGGVHWEKSLFVSDSTGAIDIVMNPQNPSVLLVAMWERVRRPNSSHLYGPTSGVYRSINGGDSWVRLSSSSGLPDGESLVGRIGLALCQSQPNIVYALYTDGTDYKASYKSSDGGLKWTPIDPNRQIANGTAGFSWYFGNIRVHPRQPQRVYALDVAFMRSDNSGASWPLNYGYGNPYSDFHVDHHALAFHPFHPDTLIEGNDGGINISYDSGVSWKKVALLPVTQFYEITMDQTYPERLYGGTQDNGTMRTRTGQVGDWEFIYGGDGFYVVVDPTNPNVIYAESQYGYLGKSTDGGFTFRSALNGINGSEPTDWSTPVVMDPSNHNVLYYGTNRVYRTTNAASLWQPISPNLTRQLPDARLGTVTTIAVAPSNSSVIYAGTDDGYVWVTDDNGTSWSNITANLPYRWVTRVAVDPVLATTAYVTFSGLKWKSPQPHVFRTRDMGATWDDISGNLPDAPVNAILVDPIQSNYLYLGNDVGCFYSDNYGESWQPLGQGVPAVPVYSMDIHKTLRQLVIGTHGRSMYRLDVNALDSKVFSRELSQGWNLLSVNVEPTDPAIEAVFDRIRDKIRVIKNNAGDVFIPQYGINTIGDLDYRQGYYAYLLQATALTFSGRPIDPGTAIALAAGWNMISYLPEAPIDAATALASIRSQLVLAKNGAGQAYLPDYGINQIGSMQPGAGYQVYLKSSATLIYPSGSSLALEKTSSARAIAARHFHFPTNTGDNATVIIPLNSKPMYWDGKPLNPGDEIGVFTSDGLCCGAAIWNASTLALPIWGDDAQTEVVDGLRQGESLHIRVFSSADERAYPASITFEQAAAGEYAQNGIFIVKNLRIESASAPETAESTLPSAHALFQNYPNPFNSRTMIRYQLKERTRVLIHIYNENGQRIRDLVSEEQEPGSYQVIWDGQDEAGCVSASGLYFCRMDAADFRSVRRLLLLK